MHLPTRSVIREVYRKQVATFGDPTCEIDDVKIGAALAWPRMMVTTKKHEDPFEVVLSLFTSILSEQPASKGNAALAIGLVILTLRRNGLMLDISNEDIMQLFSKLGKGEFSEKSLIEFFRLKSIPLSN